MPIYSESGNQPHSDSARDSHSVEKVAVIACHGVGDPKLGETVQHLATLLQRRQNSNGSTYLSFEESILEIPVFPLELPHYSKADDDIAFSIRAVNKVDSTDQVGRYSTFRFSGNRIDSQTQCKTEVDLYDMHWADFSRAPSAFMQFLGELYQIYFHLASLGRKTVREARNSHVDRGEPSLFLSFLTFLHNALAWLLPTSIPIGNLFMLVAACPLFVLLLPTGAIEPAMLSVVAVTVFTTAIALSYRLGFRYGGIGATILATTAIVILFYFSYGNMRMFVLAVACMLLILAGAWIATRLLLSRYDPWAPKWGPWISTLFFTLLLGLGAFSQWDPLLDPFRLLLLTCMWVVHFIFLLLQLMWSVVFVLLLLVAVLPYFSRFLPDASRRAANTGRLGALISTSLFLGTTLVVWAALIDILKKSFSVGAGLNLAYKSNVPILHRDVFRSECLNFGSIIKDLPFTTLESYTSCLFNLFTGYYANAFLALLGIVFVLAITVVLPSAWYESRSPSPEKARSGKESARLWNWLNTGSFILPIAECLLILAWVVQLLGYFYRQEAFVHNTWVQQAGVVFGAVIPLLILGRSLLPKAVSAVLDIVLDVSNWLKERPYSSNPRGRIILRYAGLLKMVLDYKDYDRLVIVAHSQGTVISADFLRLMQALDIWPFKNGRRPEICLLTVGSPLSQLYASRFPHWYGWAQKPNPDTLGLRIWINGYRSGDYVGRSLWGGNAVTPLDLSWEPAMRYTEASLGLGAHTHYFDRTAPLVGDMLDWLIAGDPKTNRCRSTDDGAV